MATRMQQRRGTAAQWISTNNGDGPILNAGEIGFESDTGKFKIGDGTNHWVDLDYFLDESEIDSITGDYVLANTLGVANGVATLDGSGKLTATQIPGIDELAQDAVDLALTAGTGITKTYNDNANTITIAVDTSVIATKAELAEVSQDSINDALVAGTGISKSYNDNANTITVSANNVPNSALANSSVTINGFEIALGGSATYSSDNIGEGTTNLYFSNARAQAALASDLSNKQDKVSGVSDTEIGYLDGVTSNVQAQLDSKLSSVTAASTYQTIVSGVSNTEIGYLDGVTSNVQAQLDAKAALSGAAFTGNVSTTGNLTVDGNFTVNGSNVLVSATQIQIEDSLIQLGHQNPANTVDLGFVAGYNDGSAKHSGLVKDATDAKWKLFKGVTTEPATTVDFTQATLDDLSVGALEASSLTVGSVSNTEIGYLDGVTSNVQAQLDSKLSSATAASTYQPLVSGVSNTEIGYLDGVTSNVQAQLDTKLASATAASTYAPIASPTFTGTVTLPTGTVTSGMILDGTIVNGDISASAAIDKTKISGTAITAADTGTVTNTMLAGSIANNKLANSSITINGTAVSLGGSTTISSYSAPTIGSTSIASGATVTTIAGLTLTAPTLTGTVTASGDINLSAVNGPGSLIDELNLLMMGAL
jgi:Major tropism determinant N-terminal domain